MPDQDRFGDHVTEPAGLSQPHHSDDQMKQKNEEVAHPDNVHTLPLMINASHCVSWAQKGETKVRDGRLVVLEVELRLQCLSCSHNLKGMV
jgi:hypothetical protein